MSDASSDRSPALVAELERLYFVRPSRSGGSPTDVVAEAWFDANGRTRALVLEIVEPASWEPVARVWRGVQSELKLTAPAIAVSGVDALQLWFSLAEPIDVNEGVRFLDLLRRRFLAEIDPARIRGYPEPSPSLLGDPRHAPIVPALQAGTELWSAFVSPDLAALFVDTPWLDTPPGDEAQAGLLRPLRSTPAADIDAASRRLERESSSPSSATDRAIRNDATVASQPAQTSAGQASAAQVSAAQPSDGPAAPPTESSPRRPAVTPSSGDALPFETDPRRFLLRVMNDEAVPLGLRIEAAKALLPQADMSRRATD